MGTIKENRSGIKLAVPSNVYVRMRQTIDDLLTSIRTAYQNGIGNEDELRRAERLSIGLSADLGYIEVAPEPPAPLRYAKRLRYQDRENDRPVGPALLVDYQTAPRELRLLRIVTEKPFVDLSGFTDDTFGVLEESLLDAIIHAIRKHEEEAAAAQDDTAGYLADRRYDDRIDRELEEQVPFRGEAVAHG